jgi:hypothetical protein
MKHILAFALALTLLSRAEAQSGYAETRSLSGQFVAYASTSPFPSRFYRGDNNSITLEPALLVVSCERIKQALAREIGPTGNAKGKIFLHLRPGRSVEERPTILIRNGFAGWGYHIDLPDSLDRTAFVRTLVESLLLEIANRESAERTVEIPLWLAEGLSRDLIAREQADVVLPVNQSTSLNVPTATRDLPWKDPVGQSREVLASHAPLTFDQLSWPKPENLAGEALDVFQSSAHLFVARLLRLKDGQACFRAMLKDMPNRYNWQYAFLTGFQNHFSGALDIEKWWALQLVQFTGRDMTQLWTVEESWNKLDAAVHCVIEVRSKATELPRRSEANLQSVIRDCTAPQQQTVLQRKSQELELLRSRVAPDLIPIVNDYREVLGTYLKKQNFSGSFFGLVKRTGPIRNRLAESTIRELDNLDAKRESLRPAAPGPVASVR